MDKKILFSFMTASNQGGSGLRILHSNNDYFWNSNGGEIQTELNKVDFTKASDYQVYLTKFDADGCYIVVLKFDPNRYSYQSGWLYIPKELFSPTLDGRRMQQMIEFISDQLKKSDLDKSAIDNYFSTPYPTENAPGFSPSPKIGKHAVRYYGKGTMFNFQLWQLLGEKLYQPEYAQYDWVYLIDKASGISIKQPVTDLTDHNLQRLTIVPVPQDPKGLGFTPWINGLPFIKPQRIDDKSKAEIEWRKDGFEPYTSTLGDEKPIPDYRIKKIFKKGQFELKDKETNSPLSWNQHQKAKIFINGFEIKDEGTGITYSGLDSSRVTVKLDGYHESVDMIGKDLKSSAPTDKFNLLLTETSFTYRFVIPCKINGKPHEITDQFKLQYEIDRNDTIVEGFGYDYERREGDVIVRKLKYVGKKEGNKTPYKPHQPNQQRPVPDPRPGEGPEPKVSFWQKHQTKFYALAAMLVCAALAFGVFKYCHRGSDDPSGGSQIDTTMEVQQISEQDLADINYLNSHPVWKRAEMEEIPQLKGLFDYINTYKFDEVQRLMNEHQWNCDNLKHMMTVVNDKKNEGKVLAKKWEIYDQQKESIDIERFIEKLPNKFDYPSSSASQVEGEVSNASSSTISKPTGGSSGVQNRIQKNNTASQKGNNNSQSSDDNN